MFDVFIKMTNGVLSFLITASSVSPNDANWPNTIAEDERKEKNNFFQDDWQDLKRLRWNG